MVELHTHVSRSEKREAVIKLNCETITRIIHWGLPRNREEDIQETGRAGRDMVVMLKLICIKEKLEAMLQN